MQRQTEQLGIASRCQWLGFLAGEAKWQALAAADCRHDRAVSPAATAGRFWRAARSRTMRRFWQETA